MAQCKWTCKQILNKLQPSNIQNCTPFKLKKQQIINIRERKTNRVPLWTGNGNRRWRESECKQIAPHHIEHTKYYGETKNMERGQSKKEHTQNTNVTKYCPSTKKEHLLRISKDSLLILEKESLQRQKNSKLFKKRQQIIANGNSRGMSEGIDVQRESQSDCILCIFPSFGIKPNWDNDAMWCHVMPSSNHHVVHCPILKKAKESTFDFKNKNTLEIWIKKLFAVMYPQRERKSESVKKRLNATHFHRQTFRVPLQITIQFEPTFNLVLSILVQIIIKLFLSFPLSFPLYH